MTRREEIIWLAGLLEGEGTFFCAAPTHRRPGIRVKLEMTDEDIVKRAAVLVPCATKVRACRARCDSWSTTYVKCWNGADAEYIMRAVLPYMGERRSAKIRECLATPNLSHYPRGVPNVQA